MSKPTLWAIDRPSALTTTINHGVVFRHQSRAREKLREAVRESAHQCRLHKKRATIIKIDDDDYKVMIGGRQSTALWERLMVVPVYTNYERVDETAYNPTMDRDLRLRDDAKQHYRGIYRDAEHFGFTYTVILNKRAEVLKTVAKCPRWVHDYLSGVWDQLHVQYERKLVFCYRLDGKLYSTHRNRDDYYEKHGLTAGDLSRAWDANKATSGLYWNTEHFGMRPFSESYKDGTDATSDQAEA